MFSRSVFATPWTVTHLAPLSMGTVRERILKWVSMPSSKGSLSDSGIKPGSPALQADSFSAEPQGKPLAELGVESLVPNL